MFIWAKLFVGKSMDNIFYIVTIPKLKERLDYLIPTLNSHGIFNIKIHDGYVSNDLNDDDFNKATDSIFIEEQRARITCPNYVSSGSLKTKKNMLGNALSHISIWNEIANGKEQYAIILEDDAVLVDNFRDIWNKLKSTLPNNLDIGYLHAGCGHTIDMFDIKHIPNKFWYSIEKKFSRTQCSYIISKEFCKKLIQDIFPIALPIDWEINYLQKKLNANVFWTSIHPFFEGSGIKYYSSLR